MEKISALSQRRKSGIYYGLLCEGAELTWEILRLKAETARIYQVGSRVGASVMVIHERTETFIASSSNEFQRLSTLDEDVSIVGELSLNEMIRRRDRLNERIEIRQRTGNIILMPTNSNRKD